MYGSPERRFTPLCACLAKLNAFVMISTFCGAWSLDNCPKVPETLGLSFPHPPVPESAFIRHIFASYNLYCKNIQKHIQASIFRKCIVLNLYFYQSSDPQTSSGSDIIALYTV